MTMFHPLKLSPWMQINTDSCSICGTILATRSGDFPEWSRKVRALCWFEGRVVLSDPGHRDGRGLVFVLPIYGVNRPYPGPGSETKKDICYPFHAACWSILEEIALQTSLDDSRIISLFKIFEGCHYSKPGRALSWGHDYYLEEIVDAMNKRPRVNSKLDPLVINRESLCLLWDPLHVNLKDTPSASNSQSGGGCQARSQPELVNLNGNKSTSPADSSFPNFQKGTAFPFCSRFSSLPNEIVDSIMYELSFSDTLHFLQAYEHDFRSLPATFWESRFRVYGEFGFARTLCPPNYSWKEWTLRVNSILRPPSFQESFANRRRIWRIGVNLINMIQVIKEPRRVLHGDPVIDYPCQPGFRCELYCRNVSYATEVPCQRPCAAMSCLALKDDIEGCKVLTQRSISWVETYGELQICDVTPSYVSVSGRRLLSGLTFKYSNSPSEGIGYIVGKNDDLVAPASPKVLWLVASSLGVETVALEIYPHSFVDGRSDVAVSKWSLKRLKGIFVAFDALRIVSIWQRFGKEKPILDNLLWTAPYPSSMPFMADKDITDLHNLQSKSFAPASTLCMKPENGHLVAIQVYAPLRFFAGITGIRFIYNTSVESLWGSDDDTASVSFFLRENEHIVGVKVYKIGSKILHLQFFTNLNRESQVMPQLPPYSRVPYDCVEYRAFDDGFIIGFCGCFVQSFQQLNCFGVIPTTTVATLESTFSVKDENFIPWERPINHVGKHGDITRRLKLDGKIRAVQVSVNTVPTRYRRAGQATGLLLHAADSNHPELLGQLTGAGETYELEEDEWIADLKVTTTEPDNVIVAHEELSQIEGLIIFTNQRRIEWGRGPMIIQSCCNGADTDFHKRKLLEVTWNFNAIYDCVNMVVRK